MNRSACMRRIACLIATCLAVSAVAGSLAPRPLPAQTSYPMLMSLEPVAAQVGQTSQHVVHSRYSMYGAYRVLVSGSGVTGEVVPHAVKEGEKEPNLQKLEVRFTVAEEALPGVREFRIATPRGVSTVGQLVVTREAVVQEADKNDTPEQAQQVEVPATLCGTIERAEDVDYYRFHATAGQPLSFHVRSMRLQDKIHDLQQHVDPILTLRNAAGVTLASSDNFFFGDPFISYTFEQEGDYLLEVRDVRYQGNPYWEYAIEATGAPFVTNVFPPAVAAGGSVSLEAVGFQLPEPAVVELAVPADAPRGEWWSELAWGDATSNPVPLIVSDLPLVSEQAADNNSPEQAQVLENVPCGVNGRLESEADLDCYAFQARKGERFSFQVKARRHQSALDSHLRILNDQGRELTSNDDLRLGKRNFADSWIENWTAPADGRFVIEIRDLHLRGGAPFVYFLEVTRSVPSFELYADTDKTQLTPGTGGVIFVRAVRKNGFTGAIQLHADGLPPGVTATCGRILAEKGQDGCIVLQAAADAALDVANIQIHGTPIADAPAPAEAKAEAVAAGAEPAAAPTGEEPPVEAAFAEVYQETYQPGGGRGHWPVESHTVSVGAPSDILEVILNTDEVTLQPGQSQKVDITIRRAEGFDKNVTLDVIYKHLNSVYGDTLPPGVTVDSANSKTLLTAGATEGHITFKAAADAPPTERQLAVVMANVSLNFVMKATYTSKPLHITVAPK